MNNRLCATILALSIAFFGVAPQVLADPTRNPPLVCAAKASCSTCPTKDGCACGCILVTLDLGATTAWTGQTPVYLRIHSSDETASLSTPAQLKVVMGWSFKAVDGGTTAGGAPQIVRFVQPEGAELVVHFQDGDSVGVPEPNNLGKSLARVRMVDAEGWATTSVPAFYDLYPGDGSVWRFLATGNTNERGALVSFTDPRGRVLTPDDFGVDIVRDALGNIRQVKTLTRLADVRTLSPTHYAVTVYPLTEEPEQVADTGLYALPEHAPTRVLDVAQGESVKELLVGFQKGTGDMRPYRYVAVNGDWTLHQPSGLVEAQELYFTEDESGAQRLHTIRDETGKLWSRDEYNYVSAYWGYLITNRIEGIPGDATRTTSWSYYTDGPHKDLLRETVEPTGNRIVYEYDDKNRVVRESMPLVEEETLYSYEPVDPSDPPLLCDTRPRCVVRKMQGVEIQRTYYVYGTNGVDVVERVGEQGAAYGGTNVLRTVTTYYPVTGAITDGLVQSVRHEDGTIDNYAYDLTDGVWTETVTHVHEQAPAIVPMRTTRSVRIYNTLGQLVDDRTDLCTIGVEDLVPQADWTPIERLQYAYDVDGNEIRREDLAGRLWTAEWAGNCCGKISETDWQGITTTYTYDEEGRTSETIRLQPNVVKTLVSYDRLGRFVSWFETNEIKQIGTVPTVYQYDSLGNIRTRQEGPDTETFLQSDPTRVVHVDCTGIQTRTVFSPSGDLLLVEEDMSPTIQYLHYPLTDGGKMIIRRIMVDNHECFSLTNTFNMYGQLTMKGYLDESRSLAIQETGFDSYGRIRTIQQSHKPILSFSYDSSNHVEEITATLADGDRETWINQKLFASFDVFDGQLWEVEQKVFLCSDSNIAPLISISQTQKHCFSSNIVFNAKHIDPRGNISQEIVYNERASGKTRITRTVPTSILPYCEEHSFGQCDSFSSCFGGTNYFAYDGLNRLSSSIQSNGTRKEFKYDPFDRITKETDDLTSLSFSYGCGHVLNCIDRSDGGQIIFVRDDKGRIVSINGDTSPAQLIYDEFNHMTSMCTFRNNTSTSDQTTWSYSPTGKLVEKCFPEGDTIRYESDSNHLKTFFDKEPYPFESTIWDNWGRIIDSNGSTYEYDNLGRCIRAIHSDDGITFTTNCFSYNQYGECVSESSSIGSIVRTLDDFGRTILLTVSFNSAPEISSIFSYSYDSFGRILEVTNSGIGHSFTYYDGTDEVCSISGSGYYRSFPKSNTLRSSAETRMLKNNQIIASDLWNYERVTNSISRKTTIMTNLLDRRYWFNRKNELILATENGNTNSIQYDYSGNRLFENRFGTIVEYETNADNQYLEIKRNGMGFPVFYSRDKVLQMFDSGAVSNSYEWNINHLVLSYGVNGILHKYLYDSFGRIVVHHQSILQDTGSTISFSQTDYIWNEDQLLATREIINGKTNSVFYCWNQSSPNNHRQTQTQSSIVLSASRNGEVFIPFSDLSRNIIAYFKLDGSLGAFCNFDAFGRWSECFNSELFDLWFSSRLQLQEGRLVVFPNRIYSPELGRWTSRDPIGEFGGVNLYVYCRNNPLFYHDSTGLSPDGMQSVGQENQPAKPCPCAKSERTLELEKKLREAARKTSESALMKPVGVAFTPNGTRVNVFSEYAREYAGRICCDPKTGQVSSTGPYAGSWYDEETEDLITDPWEAERNHRTPHPTTRNLTFAGGKGKMKGKVIDRTACRAGTISLIFYHSHPRSAGNNLSDADISSANNTIGPGKCVAVYVDGEATYQVYCHAFPDQKPQDRTFSSPPSGSPQQ